MHFITASLALLFSASLATSQTEKLNFRTLARSNAKMPELWVVASGKAVPISFSNSQPSTALKADKGSPLKIHKTPLDEKGKPTDTSPTLVELPATSSILLLGWMEEEKPSFLAVADPFTTAKGDDWLVINATKKPLTIQIGATATTLTVEANSQQAVKCTAPVGEGAATTVASQQADGSWKTVYTSSWPIYADQRGLVLVVQNGERITVDYIADQIATKTAPKGTPKKR
ncbi:MAG: hypothetical protein V4819_09730 [Verrucomicrobiota bacterium]